MMRVGILSGGYETPPEYVIPPSQRLYIATRTRDGITKTPNEFLDDPTSLSCRIPDADVDARSNGISPSDATGPEDM